MTGSQDAAPRPAGGQEHAERASVASLALAGIALVILLITFRGLVFITLPLSALAFLLGAWAAATALNRSHRLAAVAGFLLGLLLLLASLAALAANLTVNNGYDLY